MVDAALTWFGDWPGSFGEGGARRFTQWPHLILFEIRIYNFTFFNRLRSSR
jgi:hypothetical protein